MASGEEVGAAACNLCMSSSTVGLESLFPAEEAEQAGGDGSPELQRLREKLQGWLSQYESLVLWVQRLLVWERPLHSIIVACTLNGLFWLLSSTSLRPLFLLSLSLLGVVLLERWKHKLPDITVHYPEPTRSERESMAEHPRLLSVPELSHHLAESYLYCSLYVQEMLQYKRLHHGKFCALTCAGCIVLAVVGHYIPGIMISYIILLSVLLWPLVVYHELIQKMYTGLEPILMKLDYSMKGGTQHRKHDKKKIKKEPEGGDELLAETESESEEELSCFSPTVDVKTTALALAITDSELSDEEASILESGGFSVSRATTPQLTDVSEDLDQQSINSEPEETFSKDLPEFPSVDEFTSIEQEALRCRLGHQAEGSPTEQRGPEEPSPTGFLIQNLASPLHFVNTHFNGHGQPPGTGEEARGQGLSLEALSEEIVSTAISTVVQNTLTALLRSSEASESPSLAEFLPHEPPTQLAETEPKEETESAAREETAAAGLEEDFELLDQMELEQMDEELGLSSQTGPEGLGETAAQPSHPAPPSQHTEES
ncbi:reticulophagy regulator 2 isoform X2 [Amia ocellicauda]|uniref:reticulophagy regulator 2 isoform X2 n=1 Tax=Amia ocellicauda TaxID=2972642 RepID=UPI00346426F0